MRDNRRWGGMRKRIARVVTIDYGKNRFYVLAQFNKIDFFVVNVSYDLLYYLYVMLVCDFIHNFE